MHLAVTGIVRMDRREELTLLASASLQAAAQAWTVGKTARDLHARQGGGEPIQAGRYEALCLWLDEDFDEAVHAFRREDDKLRRHLRRYGERFELADPFRLEFVIAAAKKAGMAGDAFKLAMRNISGAESIAHVDEHGAGWLIQFFAAIGAEEGMKMPGSEPGRKASEAQLVLLRALLELDEGERDKDDRRLAAYMLAQHRIPALDCLDANTAWKAMVRLRGRIVHRNSLAA